MQVEIKAVIEVPDGTSMEAFEEWVEFELGYSGSMAADNPLVGACITCTRVEVNQERAIQSD